MMKKASYRQTTPEGWIVTIFDEGKYQIKKGRKSETKAKSTASHTGFHNLYKDFHFFTEWNEETSAHSWGEQWQTGLEFLKIPLVVVLLVDYKKQSEKKEVAGRHIRMFE